MSVIRRYVEAPMATGKSLDSKKYSVANIRTEHTNAYRAWSKEEDDTLEKLKIEGKSVSELAKIFERKEGSIVSRLKKLGF